MGALGEERLDLSGQKIYANRDPGWFRILELNRDDGINVGVYQ